jgi:hypothetical protein
MTPESRDTIHDLKARLSAREKTGQRWTHCSNGWIVSCEHCGVSKEVSPANIRRGDEVMSQVSCMGSDECLQMLCDSCRAKCPTCGVDTCAEHLEAGQCDVCRKEEAKELLCR